MNQGGRPGRPERRRKLLRRCLQRGHFLTELREQLLREFRVSRKLEVRLVGLLRDLAERGALFGRQFDEFLSGLERLDHHIQALFVEVVLHLQDIGPKLLDAFEDDLPDVASPLAAEDFVFTASSSGVVSCYDLDTGRKLWSHEFDESFYPSPILAAGRIYAMDNGGTMHVFRASKAFVPVADSRLGEESVATPAFVGDTMFLRGQKNLYGIGPP